MQVIPYIVFGFFLLFGGFLLLMIVAAAWEGVRTRRWPATVGKVVRSGITTEVNDRSDTRANTSVLHGAEVVYEYQVGGEKCTGTAVQTGKMKTSSPRWAQRIAGRYQTGDDVVVFYNPAEPTEAVLEPGVPSGLWIIAILGLPLFAVGLIGVLATAGWLSFQSRDLQLILGGGLTLIGAALGGLALRNFWVGAASRRWPTTDGRVIASVVREWTTDASTTYEPHVVYEYAVDGTKYAHSTTSAGFGIWQSDEQVAAVVARYPVDAVVTVSYDPARPERAVLEPGPRWSNLFLLLFALPFFGIGVGFLVARFVA